ncbi:MAG: hypothetical protein LAT64_04360 [Phycisphaerales bacterium]|nr:hypothetical protein [Planctomycetota bacterium]MCH8507986.1 hypothetical protein [Phycisphaerales bacterium]
MDSHGPQPPGTVRVTITEQGRSVRVPALLAQFLALVFFLGLLVVGLIVFIPLAIIAGVVFLITLVVVWVRLKLARARSPNGPLDGRRNVRVRR